MNIDVFDSQKRQKTDNELRSEALNRYIVESGNHIKALSAQLSLARYEARFAWRALGFVLLVSLVLTGYMAWRTGQ